MMGKLVKKKRDQFSEYDLHIFSSIFLNQAKFSKCLLLYYTFWPQEGKLHHYFEHGRS